MPLFNPSGGSAPTAAPSGALVLAVTTKTSSYTLGATDGVVLVNATGTTQTLPLAGGAPGRVYTLKNINNAAQTTVVGSGGDLIDGAASYLLVTAGSAVSLQSDGGAWRLL